MLPVGQILDDSLRILCKVELLFRDRVYFACFYVQIRRDRIVRHFERFNDHVELHFSSHAKQIVPPIRPRGTCNHVETSTHFPVHALIRVENTALMSGWVEDWVIRPDSPGFGVAESFSTYAGTWIVW